MGDGVQVVQEWEGQNAPRGGPNATRQLVFCFAGRCCCPAAPDDPPTPPPRKQDDGSLFFLWWLPWLGRVIIHFFVFFVY